MLLRLLDMSLVLICVLLVAYLCFRVFPAISGYTMDRPSPHHTVRLQIVDASGQFVPVQQLARQIEAASDVEFEVAVVETGRFDVRRVTRSFVVSRQEDLAAARILAARLGLSPDDVEYKPLENNQKVITATLVIGADGVRPTVLAVKT